MTANIILTQFLTQLRELLLTTFTKIDTKFVKRSRKINVQYLFLALVDLMDSKSSYSLATTKLMSEYGYVSKSSLCKFREKIPWTEFKELYFSYIELVNKLKIFDTKYKLLAVDGTKLIVNRLDMETNTETFTCTSKCCTLKMAPYTVKIIKNKSDKNKNKYEKLNVIKDVMNRGEHLTHVLNWKISNQPNNLIGNTIRIMMYNNINNMPRTYTVDEVPGITMQWLMPDFTSSAYYYTNSIYNDRITKGHVKLMLKDLINLIKVNDAGRSIREKPDYHNGWGITYLVTRLLDYGGGEVAAGDLL